MPKINFGYNWFCFWVTPVNKFHPLVIRTCIILLLGVSAPYINFKAVHTSSNLSHVFVRLIKIIYLRSGTSSWINKGISDTSYIMDLRHCFSQVEHLVSLSTMKSTTFMQFEVIMMKRNRKAYQLHRCFSINLVVLLLI